METRAVCMHQLYRMQIMVATHCTTVLQGPHRRQPRAQGQVRQLRYLLRLAARRGLTRTTLPAPAQIVRAALRLRLTTSSTGTAALLRFASVEKRACLDLRQLRANALCGACPHRTSPAQVPADDCRAQSGRGAHPGHRCGAGGWGDLAVWRADNACDGHAGPHTRPHHAVVSRGGRPLSGCACHPHWRSPPE